MQHLCEHSRINILQWILTKLGTFLVLKRVWNPLDFQGQMSGSPGQIFRRGDTPRFALPLVQDNYADINEPLHPLMALNLFEDTTGVINIHELNKNIQYNGQNKKYKRKNNNLQNICIKLLC
jgi:hypothetical protein